MNLCGVIHRCWQLASLPGAMRFAGALRQPRARQEAILAACLRQNAGARFGREHRFDRIGSVEEYRRQVPIRSYDALEPYVERICKGEGNVLTRERVCRLIPSSGSTAACKLIPCTAGLLRQFRQAIAPWIADLFRRYPSVRDGPAYWQISPAMEVPAQASSNVPIGFGDDSAYLGGVFSRLIEQTFAVPASIVRTRDIDSFRFATLVALLRARDLRLISVWHPTFLALLLDTMQARWSELQAQVGPGLQQLDPANVRSIWPHLAVVSCWADAGARGAAAELEARWPGVAIEPKGLIATEAFVTVPLGAIRPLAVCSHFFEFISDAGDVLGAHELEAERTYELVITTAGGLYRYRLGDAVRVTGFVERTPALELVGRVDRVSDARGEKLSEGFVAAALDRVLKPVAANVRFAMLAPEQTESPVPGYVLYVQCNEPLPPGLGVTLEAALQANPHYRYCVLLGQLAPADVVQVARGAHEVYLERMHRRGMRLGDIKPSVLCPVGGWRELFTGAARGRAAAARPS